MPIMIENDKVKLMCGDRKISKMYCQGDVIYSSGNTVTYVVQGVEYIQEYGEGESVLSPSFTIPTIQYLDFIGWSQSSTSASVETNLVMGDSPITLYAVYKAKDTQTYLTNYNFVANINGGSNTKTWTLLNIDTRYYSSGIIYEFNNYFSVDGRGASGSAQYEIGSNRYTIASFQNVWNLPYGQDSYKQTTGYKNYTTSIIIPNTGGVSPLKLILTGTVGYYNVIVDMYFNWQTSNRAYIKLTGRTVIG